MSLVDKFQTIGGRIASQRHMSAVRDGIILSLPLTLAGSIFLIIRFLPIPGWESMMGNLFGEGWTQAIGYPIAATFDLIGVIACIGISYRLAESHKVEPIMAAIISLCGYFTLVPSYLIQDVQGIAEPIRLTQVWSFTYTGANSLFIIIISSILCTEIYKTIVQKGLTIKLPENVPPNVAKSLTAIIPGFFVLFTMWVVRIFFALTPFECIHTFVNTLITKPITSLGSTLPGYAFLVLFKDLLWSLGIHGSSALSPIFQPLEATFRDANRVAAEMGQPLPYIISGQLWREIFAQIGGGGNTFPLVIMSAFFAKSSRLRSIGQLSFAPAIFGINEPIIFGLPIVLNPLMVIPFVSAPIVGTCIAYVGTRLNLVGRMPGIDIPWTTPPLLNAFIASGGQLSVVVCQTIVIICSAMIYYPFFKILDNQAFLEESKIKE